MREGPLRIWCAAGARISRAVGALVAAALPIWAHAHLLADGQATVNVQEGKAFVVVSLPVSWLGAVDDDRDGHLSMAELQVHRVRILKLLDHALLLENAGQVGPLRDVLLSPSAAHHRQDGAGTHLLVVGARVLSKPADEVLLRLNFAGPTQSLQITATRAGLRQVTSVQGPNARSSLFGPRAATP